MENGEIVTVVTLSGEYVGKLTEFKDGWVTISSPRMILQNPENNSMGFARGIAVTGIENPDEVTFQSVVFVTPTNDRVRTAWEEATSQIVTPTKPTLVK
tara:strand:+ start:183 stop:479 length:297 start_codon:yes stop_codon:yes gene_type:complete